MKKLISAMLLASITLTGLAQTVDLRRKIEVNGVATKEVTPDIIHVSITLKEYLDGKTKITISDLERQLEKAVSDAGIPKADFTVNDLSSYNYTYQKKKNPDFLASKQYGIVFHDLNRYNQIISQVDAKGIQATNIDSYDYSKMADIKRELKIAALMAAKEKATYLLAAVNQRLGDPLEISDNDDVSYPQPRMMTFAKVMTTDAAPESDIDVKTIKLNFQVHAVFEIVK